MPRGKAKRGKGKGKGKGKGSSKAEKQRLEAEQHEQMVHSLFRFHKLFIKKCTSVYGISDASYYLPISQYFKAFLEPPEASKGDLPPLPKQLIIERQVLPETIEALCDAFLRFPYPGFRSLCVWNADIKDKGAERLLQFLPHWPNVNKVEFRDSLITAAGCATIGRLLQPFAIRYLTLDHNRLGNKGLQHLGSFLSDHKTLQTVSLNYCELCGVEAGRSLRDWLSADGCNLTSLSLDGNHLGNEGILALAQGIVHNSKLTRLSLSLNGLGDDESALTVLSFGIQRCKTLKVVDLSGNLIGVKGLGLLFDNLQECTTVQTLKLSFSEHPLYKQLMDLVAANAPKKSKKKKKKKKKKEK